jgi:hypothetical protein
MGVGAAVARVASHSLLAQLTYQSTQCYNPEGHSLNINRRQTSKSYIILCVSVGIFRLRTKTTEFVFIVGVLGNVNFCLHPPHQRIH